MTASVLSIGILVLVQKRHSRSLFRNHLVAIIDESGARMRFRERSFEVATPMRSKRMVHGS